jgi:hypothetical protein
MSETGYKICNQEAIHYCTFSIVYWIDIFSRFIYPALSDLQSELKSKGFLIRVFETPTGASLSAAVTCGLGFYRMFATCGKIK